MTSQYFLLDKNVIWAFLRSFVQNVFFIPMKVEVLLSRVRKYAKFGVFYAKIVQMTPLRLRRESLRLQKFSVTNTVLSLSFSQQIQFTLIVNVVNIN